MREREEKKRERERERENEREKKTKNRERERERVDPPQILSSAFKERHLGLRLAYPYLRPFLI